MKQFIIYGFCLGWFAFVGFDTSAQLANDACSGAINLGTLGTPNPCNGFPGQGQGAPSSYTGLTNIGAMAENPYISTLACQPLSNNMASPADDVWYMVTLTGNALTVNISGGIGTPEVAIYEGACGTLTPRGCAIGSAGNLTATFDQMFPGTTVYIQVSGGGVGDQGNFNMTLQNDNSCADCLNQSNLTVNPLPVNGTYQGGTTVTFCYQITEWTQQNTNWLHGVCPVFGNGWDLTTLTVVPSPTCDLGGGVWNWFNNVSTPDGILSGFFFDGNPGPDGNPINNFGDNCQGTGMPWSFCWTVTANSCPPGNTGDDLGIVIHTFGDGETGNWGNIACQNDPNYVFSASLSCCVPPIMSQINVTCNGGTDGSATADGQGVGPFDYSWADGVGTPITSVTGIAGPHTINNLTAGVYNVTVTDQNDGCITTGTVTITEPTAVVATPSSVNSTCGLSNGSVSVAASGGLPGYTYNWSTGCTTATCNNLPAAVYSVTVTDASGCTANASVTVTDAGGGVASITTSSNPLCNGSCDGSATATMSGGNTPFTYAWSTGGSTATVSNLCAGLSTVTVTDNIGCTSTTNVTLTDPPLLTASISTTTDVSCFGGNDGSATVIASGGTTGYTYLWPSGGSAATETMLAAGSFTVTVTDANGCTTIATATINQPTLLTAAISATTDVSCFGGNDGSATVSATGGTSPLAYQWPSGGSSTTESMLSAGSYTVTVTDANGCTATATAVINQPTLLIATISATTDVSCFSGNDGSATVTASGGTTGYTYLWPSGGSAATESMLTAGSYTVTVTDAMGCTATATAVINQPTALSATTSTVSSTCGQSNGSVSVTPSGATSPYSYNWSSGCTTANCNSLPAGTYDVTVTDAMGCTFISSATITDLTGGSASISSFNDPSCNGACDGSATVLAIGGNTPYTYAWSSGGTAATESNLCAGTFTATVTDNVGCTATATVTITDPPLLTASITASTNVSCNGGSDGSATVSATGGTSPLAYQWPSGGSSTTESMLSAGSYTVTVTDANGCTATATAVITEPTLLTFTSSSVDVTCFGGSDGSAIIIPSGGTTPYSYLWSNGGSAASATNLSAGSYSVTVTDNNGCTVNNSYTINEPAGINLSSTAVDAICNGDCNGSVDLTASGGTTPYAFAWSNGASTEDLSALCAGSYAVTITDGNGCSQILSQTVNEPTPMTVTASPDQNICYSQSAVISASASGGNGGPYTYSWDQGLPQGSPQTVNPTTSTCYTVFATDPQGCSSPTDITCVNVSPPLTVTASPDVSICDGDNTTLSATASGGNGGPYTLSWSNGAGQGSPVTVSPSGYPASQSYIVTLSDGCSPPVTDTVQVSFYTTPNVVFVADNTFGCEPLTVTFTQNTTPSSQLCSWDFGNGFAQSSSCGPVIQTFPTGTYDVTLTVVTDDGCSSYSAITDYITVNPNPTALFNASPQPTTTQNTTIDFTDQSIGNISIWNWSFYGNTGNVVIGNDQSQNPTFIFPADTGTFPVNLSVITDAGCTADTTLFVVIHGIFNIWFPNAITPDGNGYNDVFYPKGVGIDENDYTMYIFDRWGEIIFESHRRLEDPWDGTARAKGGHDLVENGVYVWKVHVGDINKESHEYIGHVTVIH